MRRVSYVRYPLWKERRKATVENKSKSLILQLQSTELIIIDPKVTQALYKTTTITTTETSIINRSLDNQEAAEAPNHFTNKKPSFDDHEDP